MGSPPDSASFVAGKIENRTKPRRGHERTRRLRHTSAIAVGEKLLQILSLAQQQLWWLGLRIGKAIVEGKPIILSYVAAIAVASSQHFWRKEW
jgi:hypothetical protein